MTFTRIAGVLMAATVAFGLVACGDEKQDDQTRDELVNAANAVCTKFDNRFREIEKPKNPRNTQQAAIYWDEAAPATEAETIELSALDPNDEMEDDWNAFIAKRKELDAASAKVASKAVKSDRSYINDLDEVQTIQDDANRLVRTIGARSCVTE